MDALLVCCTGLTGTSGVPSTKAADPNIFKGSGSYQPRSFCVPRRLLPQSHRVPGSRGVVDRPPIDGRLWIVYRNTAAGQRLVGSGSLAESEGEAAHGAEWFPLSLILSMLG